MVFEGEEREDDNDDYDDNVVDTNSLELPKNLITEQLIGPQTLLCRVFLVHALYVNRLWYNLWR